MEFKKSKKKFLTLKDVLYTFILILFSFLESDGISAKVSLPNVLTSNMVLQRNKPVAIWGKALPGERVVVEFAGQRKNCQASFDGTWLVHLNPMKASFEKRDMIIKGEENTLRLENILVGEVWLCSGQSNMEYPMDCELYKYAAPLRGNDLAKKELNESEATNLRLFLVEKKYGLEDCQTKGWQEVGTPSTAFFSAVAYFMGKTLQQALQVPVGIIASSWGGSRIESWISNDSYMKSSFSQVERKNRPGEKRTVALYYDTMIKSLAPYTLRGFAWYQGESDAFAHDSLYVEKFKTLLDNWRTIFRNKKLPMYYVQIAPYHYTYYNCDEYVKPWFADMQTECMKFKHTGQVIVTDLVDNVGDIHPPYKWEVGRRLALWALAKDYNMNTVGYHSPYLKHAKIKGNKIILSFHLAGSQLVSGTRDAKDNSFKVTNEKLTWFEVAGNDGRFQPVEATVENNKVILDISKIYVPIAIRFGWHEKAVPNLFNMEGLPATPFKLEL